jgi:hypothetical protein
MCGNLQMQVSDGTRDTHLLRDYLHAINLYAACRLIGFRKLKR